MTTNNNLTIEQMREIVEGAPEAATHYNMNILGGHYAREGVLKMKTQWEWFNMINKEWYFDFAEHNHIALLDLRKAIAEHDEFKVGDLVVIKANPFWPEDYLIEKVEQKHIGKWYMNAWRHAKPEEIKAGHRIDDTTDYVTDIRNHLSPSTVVIEHE